MIHHLLFDSRFSYLFQVLPFSILIGSIYCIIRFYCPHRAAIRNNMLIAEIFKVLFIVYLAGLFALICTPPNFWTAFWYNLIHKHPRMVLQPLFNGSFNLTPSFFRYLTGELTGGEWAFFMQYGNALLFLPFGLLFPFCLSQPSMRKTIIYAFALSLLVELLQPIVSRSFDIDDLINNMLGTVIGYLLYFPTRKISPLLNK